MLDEDSLQQMITDFRNCKTQAEERKFINRQRAEIRNKIQDWSLDKKADAILKLIWINMMGNETDFVQVECMNALFCDNFRTKLIGYLGLTLFLFEKSEVLMMATNRIRIDLQPHNNFHIISMALKTFAEIGDKNMTNDLFQYILELVLHDSKYVRKKAMLACIRVLNKQPSLVTELKCIIPNILLEKNHGLLMCSINLAKTVIKIKPEYKNLFHDSLNNLYEVIEDLQRHVSFNYQIETLNDPILQTTILSFIKELAITDDNIAAEFGQKILLVYNKIKNENSAPVFCLLYECARCIMQINSSHAMKKVGISILGRFLEMKHSNFLYLSLKMLYYASSKYKDEVAKYEDLIKKCVKNKDFTIKKLSIQILKNIVNKDNVEKIFKLILKELNQEKDEKQAKELFTTLLQILEKNPLSLVWFEEKVLQILNSVHYKINEQDLFNFFDIVSNFQSLQIYLLYKSIMLLNQEPSEDKESLIKTVVWLVGEFGELLLNPVNEEQQQVLPKIKLDYLIETIKNLNIKDYSNTTNYYIVISLAKLYVKCYDENIRNQIKNCLNHFSQNANSFLKMKIYQYQMILNLDSEILEELLEPIPACSISYIFEGIKEGNINYESLKQTTEQFNRGELKQKKSIEENILDLDDLKIETQNDQQADNIDFLNIGVNDEVKNLEKQQDQDVELLELDNSKDENKNQEQKDYDFLDLDIGQQKQQQIEETNKIQQNEIINPNLEGNDEFLDLINDQQQINDENDQKEKDQVNPLINENNQKNEIDKNEEILNLNNNPKQNEEKNPYDFLTTQNKTKNQEQEEQFDDDEDEFVETEVDTKSLVKIKIFENDTIMIEYTSRKINPTQSSIKLYFRNLTNSLLVNLNLKIAVKKSFKILNNYLNKSMLEPFSQNEVYQDLIIMNESQNPQMALKVRLSFQKDGLQFTENMILSKISLI